MSLLNKIESVQKKPERIKKRILFASVSLIMFIVMTIWVSTLKISLGESISVAETKIASPISIFKEMISESIVAGVYGVKDSFEKIKKITGNNE